MLLLHLGESRSRRDMVGRHLCEAGSSVRILREQPSAKSCGLTLDFPLNL